jgi:hypothetical protein
MFFKKENPSVYGQVLHSISLQNILGLQSSINISSYSYLPANLSLVYFVNKNTAISFVVKFNWGFVKLFVPLFSPVSSLA